jgi:L-threonylcarbamoyladenylate synthase
LKSIPTQDNVIRLASPEGVNDFARILYSALRNADQLGINRIVIAQPQGNGLAAAIRDRLAKSASGR